MDLGVGAFLFAAGIIGGAVNAVAGGGTLFTFPAMLAVGVPPIAASASSYVAIWPGHAMAIPAYRHELTRHKGGLKLYGLMALVGGIIGAWLLLRSGDRLFAQLIPWLILLATALFAASPYVPRLFGAHPDASGVRPVRRFAVPVAFLIMSLYGGYFGAGLGVMLLAGIIAIGIDKLQEANALKNLLATIVTTVGVAIFVWADIVLWLESLAMLAGSLCGGYWGAIVARRMNEKVLRGAVIATGLVLTAYYFYV